MGETFTMDMGPRNLLTLAVALLTAMKMIMVWRTDLALLQIVLSGAAAATQMPGKTCATRGVLVAQTHQIMVMIISWLDVMFTDSGLIMSR
jgi:hypothetical protein